MDWIIKRLPSFRIIFTISLVLAASLSNNLAGAQQMCAELFDGPSFGIALQELNESTEVLLSKFRDPTSLEVSQLEHDVRQLEKSTETFLTAAGIGFNSATLSRPTPEIKADYVLQYKVYELTGSSSGSPLAKMINGALMLPEAKVSNLTFALDPLYLLNFKSSSAHFRDDIMTILIGPHEFAENLVATGANLRHEIQHFLEQWKMIKGENTLARVVFKSRYGQDDMPYSDLFRADEIETHLRDIRFLSNTAINKNSDKKLAEIGYSEEFFPRVNAYRETVIHAKKQYLQHFATQLRMAVASLETQLTKEKPWYKILTNVENGDVQVSFSNPGHYGEVTVNLSGLIKTTESNDSAKVSNALGEVLAWSKTRLNQIDREMNILSARKK